MEELKERVSDIVTSPVIQKIWQCTYRQLTCLCLVLLLLLFSSAVNAEESRVSRYDLVSAIYERVYNRKVTELEAINTGLIDAYDDGRFHLDWPVSRGMAADTFYRLSIQSGSAARLPRAFADIGNESPFKKDLEVVGGAFLPQRRGNFDAEHLFDRKEMFRVIKTLIAKDVIKQEDRYEVEIEILNEPVETIAVSTKAIEDLNTRSIRPELGFEQRDSLEKDKFKADAYKRFERADRQVAARQLNPQVMASVEDATEAMEDVEKIIKSLGGSVLEMTSTYPSNSDDQMALRHGLAKIEAVLKTIIERFKFSKLQLSTVMPVSPDQIKKCADLDIRIDKILAEAGLLCKRIAARLAEPQKEN